MIWNRAFAEALRVELPARTGEIIDFLSDNPGRKFNIQEMINNLELGSEHVLRGLMGELTKASKRAGISQDEEHSWFVIWTDQPEFQYWLSQERADWWNRDITRNYWALVSNPTIYRIEEAVKNLRVDWWVTKGSAIKKSDRVIIWKTLGKSRQRGVIAFGEIISTPEIRPDAENKYWINPEQANRIEERVLVQYKNAPKLPLWLTDRTNEFLSNFPVAHARGGTVFKITNEQWEHILIEGGGWSELDIKNDKTTISWMLQENRIIVAEYFSMLENELKNQSYSKVESRRRLIPRLNNRSHGAIERKHQNISAILRDLDYPIIDGYKPLSNYQRALAEEVIRQLNEKQLLFKELGDTEKNVEIQEISQSQLGSLETIFVEPPLRYYHPEKDIKLRFPRATLKNIDFAQKEARN